MIVERTGTLVGRAMASVVNLLDLPLAVVSGSVALGFGEPFFAAAQAEMDLRCGLDFARGARVVPGGSGGRRPAGGRGAGRAARRGAGRVTMAVAASAGGPQPDPGGAATAWSWSCGPWRRTLALWWAASAHCGGWPGAAGGAGLRSCPFPASAYWRFRLGDRVRRRRPSEALEPADVVAYLRWCQRSRPRRG